MKMLLLGYSDIARRRVLPALRRVGVSAVDIASRSTRTVPAEHHSARLYADYDVALRDTDAAIVYISTVNSMHEFWARKALEAGFHVLVDKPAFLTLKDTGELVELAIRQGVCLAEVVTFSYHPRIEAALRQFESGHSRPTHIVAAFSFPPLPPANFRYRPDLGGGALWDLGPYAANVGRIFFGDLPTDIIARATERQDGLEVSFSVLTTYSGGRTCVGSYGYTTGYINHLDVLGPGMTIGIDRVFSPPPDRALEITVRHRDEVRTVSIPANDAFALFFEDILAAIASGNTTAFASRMLENAQALDRLRASALGRGMS